MDKPCKLNFLPKLKPRQASWHVNLPSAGKTSTADKTKLEATQLFRILHLFFCTQWICFNFIKYMIHYFLFLFMA